MPAYLIAHTDQRGLNAAQATVTANTEQQARGIFARRCEDRVLTAVAERVGRGPTRRERKGR